MHDMLHDLAMLAANGKCLSIIGDELHSFATSDNVRHLAIVDCNLSIMNKVKKGCKRLHSLLLHVENEGFDDAFHEFVCKDLKGLKSLRLLQIDAPYMTTLPDVFGHMIHLRYLDISYTEVTHLPKSICLLYHLQVLSIVHAPLTCSYQLPKDINHLTKLRYLDFPRRLINGMFRIGRLTVLQELDGFNVKDEDGCRIGELKHMNQLQKLSIFAIEKVKEKEEASLTKLVEKQHLTTLSLNWWSASTNNCYIQNGGGCDLDEEVFDRLQPPKSLKQLTIAAYRGIRSAVWMKKPHLITNLESITLSDCLGWEGLPPLSQLPFLKSLCLRNMPQVKCLGQKIHGECENSGFPSLEKLDIVDLISLHDWFQMGENVTPSQWFPRLQQLRIHGCPKLRDIPSIPLSLVKLSIYNVGIVNFPGHDDNISSDNKNYLSMSSKLSRIEIVKCGSITTFPSIEVLQRFVALKVLRIDSCEELMSLEGLQALRSLEFLIIYDCQKLAHHELVEDTKCSSSLQILELANLSNLLSVPYKSISTLQSLKIHRFEELACFPEEVEWWLLQNRSLHCLEFISLKSLEFLPTSLSSLYSLNHLRIQTLPLLEKLPELPTSLQYLFLSDLDSLHLAPTCLHSCLSLTDLRITKIPSIKTLPDFPCFLQRLKLNDLASLSSLPSSIHNLSSLKYLTIQKMPLLEELPDLPPFLKYLELEELEALQSLPSCFSELSFLLDLVLTGISQIQILPDLPLSIQVLRINKPHPVLKERCQRNVGLDWPKIAHIYHVSIST